VGSLRKLRHFPLDFGFGSLNEAVRVEHLETQVLHFLRRVGFTGVCGIEFKYDSRDAQFKFIELNPRFELAHHLVATAGADVARTMHADIGGYEPESRNCYRVGMRWISLALDLKACRALFARGELSFSAWVRSMRNVRTEALLTWDDPLPGLCSYGRTLRCAFLPQKFNAAKGTVAPAHGEAR
jgi:predicted ATP-grasp superfamily ATP-dependent carboligase